MIEASFRLLGIAFSFINEEGLQGMEEIKSVDTVVRLQVVWVRSTRLKSEPQGRNTRGNPRNVDKVFQVESGQCRDVDAVTWIHSLLDLESLETH